jgi:hypothetical protein
VLPSHSLRAFKSPHPNIKAGHLQTFRGAVCAAVKFVEDNAPQLMVQTFIDETEMRAVSFQLHRNSADVLCHWQMPDAHIQSVSEHCSVEKFEVYGNPSDEVVRGVSQFINDGRGMIMPPLTGFSRLKASQRSSEFGELIKRSSRKSRGITPRVSQCEEIVADHIYRWRWAGSGQERTVSRRPQRHCLYKRTAKKNVCQQMDGWTKAARAYVVYRQRKEELRGQVGLAGQA